MSKVRVLSDALASQVAAGEVVERPAAVVRELVDNALDAKSTHIEVAIQRGGTALIRVTDNGSGMEREDALLCIERHATSKIRTSEDLAAILTYGFRGEALPSIASVSRFRLVTREHSALSGTEIEVHGGKVIAVKDGGGAPGTMVEVRSLFFNVPARRKFLRTEQTEYAHVEQQFILHAIAHPQVSWTLVKDGQTVYQLAATNDLQERISGLVGRELAERLILVLPQEKAGIEVYGYVGVPSFSRSNKQLQIVYLNGRAVENAAIHHGLREGYHTALMKGQYPVCFLFLRMDAHGYDVNVHPAKKEVRFHDSYAVRGAISTAVQQALQATERLPTGHAVSQRPPTVTFTPVEHDAADLVVPVKTQVPPLIRATPQQTELAIPRAEQTALRRDWAELPPVEKADSALNRQDAGAPASAPVAAEAKETPLDYRLIGVLNKLYVLLESREGLVLMDQHAAHERVLFEKVRSAMEKEGVPSQRLLMPLMLQVAPRDYDLLTRHLAQLHRLGIEAEAFGANTLKVDALPTFMQNDDPAALLSTLLEELAGLSAKSSSLRLGEDMIASTACRHAIKANDTMRPPELHQLMRDLMACEMPYCCPHGRPTLIQIGYPELEKKFGRRV